MDKLSSNWQVKSLGDICSITTGDKDVNEGDVNGQYPFFTCAAEPLTSASYSFEDESILLPGNGANVGLVLYYYGKFEAYQRTYVLNKFSANVKYIYYHLRDRWKKSQTNKQFGSATNYIRYDNIASYKIPLPPLQIQKQIAEILEKSDEAKQKRKEANKLTDEFLQSVFIEMFGDPVKNPKGWERKTLPQIISGEKNSLKRGPFGSSLKKDIFVKSGFLVYEQYHALNNDFKFQRYFIDAEKYKELEMFKVSAGDLIVSCSGVYLGKIAEVPKGAPKGIINQALLKITLDRKSISTQYFKF